jgi:hypothetical protein
VVAARDFFRSDSDPVNQRAGIVGTIGTGQRSTILPNSDGEYKGVTQPVMKSITEVGGQKDSQLKIE